MSEDTIVAAATPPGIGGIGIVRLSGAEAADIAKRLIGALPPPREAAYRYFRDAAGEPLDRGLALYFPAPHSFTGEDVVELHAHGGPQPIAMLVDAAVAAGARIAMPGEFTRRAFLNDKLDLAQAEAVADLISSGSSQAARAALRSLSGEFSQRVLALAEEVERVRMHVEAAIDFPEEEIDFLADAGLIAAIDKLDASFAALIRQVEVGRVLRDGFNVVIVGKPNVGKSSLMNSLSGTEAAIVTEIAGTTRDILRERINIDGLVVELVDTAGLRENPERVEAEGIRRARKALQSADAVLWIQDASAVEAGDVDEALPEGVPVLVVRNKIDLSGEAAGASTQSPTEIRVSATTGAGLESLRTAIRQLAGYRDLGEQAVTARRRHVEAIRRGHAHFVAGRGALQAQRAGEVFAEELRLAHHALGEITGQTSSDELLGRIFSTFCIGK